jgi:uncharacterized membrane protein YfcA
MSVTGGSWYGFVVVGLAIGVVGGMLGIGGGVLVIPALVFLFGFSQKMAVGTSLAMLLPPIGIFALMRYWPDNVSVRAGVFLACGFAVGGYFGSWLANSRFVSERGLRILFAVFLLYVAGNLLFRSENRVVAGLKTAGVIAGYGVVYVGARMLGRRIERGLDVGEVYRRRIAGAPLAPDYEI